ncbi:Protein trichome birefringence-like 13 [Capsicum chinense]|nr:Protein trichome birefringence-like 13 [Capsicum chinense]
MSRRPTRRFADTGSIPFVGSLHPKSRPSPLLSLGLVVGALLIIGYVYHGSGGRSAADAFSRLEGGTSCTAELHRALPVLKKAYGDNMRKVLHVGPDACSVVSKLLKEEDTEAWGIEPYDLDETDSNCKALVHKGIVRVADIKFPLPYRSKSFSLVVVSDAADYLSPRYLNKTLPELARVAADGLVILSGYPGQQKVKGAELSKFGRPAKLRSSSWWIRFFIQTSLEENEPVTKKFEQAAAKRPLKFLVIALIYKRLTCMRVEHSPIVEQPTNSEFDVRVSQNSLNLNIDSSRMAMEQQFDDLMIVDLRSLNSIVNNNDDVQGELDSDEPSQYESSDDDQSSGDDDDDNNDENVNGESTFVGVYTDNHSSIAIPYLDHTKESLEELSAGFVGDSLNRNMFVSLFCTLKRVSGDVKKWRPAGADRGFTFLKYNLTISYHRTNLLARYVYNCAFVDVMADNGLLTNVNFQVFKWSANANGGVLESLGYKEGYRVDVDVPEGTWADAPSFHDILIFNTGHWWWAPSKFDPVKSPMLFFEKGNPVVPPVSPDSGLDMVLKHMISYLNKRIRPRTTVFMRTQSPRHFEGGDWDQGGSCQRSQPLSSQEVEELFSLKNNGTNVEVRLVNQHLYRAFQGTRFHVLDVSHVSEFRADAHPSTAGGKKHDDCMHWCLPGLTDIWNDLFVAYLRNIEDRT